MDYLSFRYYDKYVLLHKSLNPFIVSRILCTTFRIPLLLLVIIIRWYVEYRKFTDANRIREFLCKFSPLWGFYNTNHRYKSGIECVWNEKCEKMATANNKSCTYISCFSFGMFSIALFFHCMCVCIKYTIYIFKENC